MKKLFALLLVLIMMFSIAACDENTDASSEDTTAAPSFNFAEIMSGNGSTSVIWGKQDEATKQSIIAEGKKDGMDISFGSDGSMTIVDSESGDIITQNPDGTWTVKGDDGNEGQLGGNWPENDFTKLLPKPSFSLLAANTSETDFSVAFQDVTVEQIKEYVEQVKAKGFTVDAETTDQSVAGMSVYMYQAQNADGYTVTVTFTSQTSGISLEKP